MLLTLLLGGRFSVWAQGGFTAVIPQFADAKVELNAYLGLDVVTIDVLSGDSDGRFHYDSILPLGMYCLLGEGIDLEFLSIGSPVSLTMDDIFDPQSVHFVDDPVNTRWSAYQVLRKRYRFGNKEPETFMRLTDSLIADASDYAARLIRVDRVADLHEEDFQDVELITTNVLTTKIVGFLEQTGDDFIAGSDHILQMTKANMAMYEFVLQYLLKGFTALGLSEVTDHLLNFPCLAEGEITEEEGRRLVALTEPFQKVKVGAKAPDIQMVSLDGNPYHLYDSEAERIIVFFWAVDCEYCHDFLVNIRKHLDLDGDFELVTFAVAENEKEVRRELKALRLKGWHCYDEARWEGKAFLDYHVVSTPTVFVLDRDKTILCKPYDWEEMERFLGIEN